MNDRTVNLRVPRFTGDGLVRDDTAGGFVRFRDVVDEIERLGRERLQWMNIAGIRLLEVERLGHRDAGDQNMSTRLIERLRNYSPPDRTDDELRQASQDIHDAADEIERLSRKLANIVELTSPCQCVPCQRIREEASV